MKVVPSLNSFKNKSIHVLDLYHCVPEGFKEGRWDEIGVYSEGINGNNVHMYKCLKAFFPFEPSTPREFRQCGDIVPSN